MALEFLDAFPNPSVPLLLRLARLIGDDLLQEIAEADYGYEAQRNLEELRRLRDEGDLATLRAFPVREVLELTRWAEPEAEQERSHRTRIHLKRAFACAALLHYACEPEGAEVIIGTNDSLGPLIESMTALNLPWRQEAAGVVCALVRRLDGSGCDDELAFCGVALIWFGLDLAPPISDAALAQLCAWTSEREQVAAHRRYGTDAAPDRWLLSSAAFSQRGNCWSNLGRLLQAADVAGRSDEVRDWVRLIGRSLAGD